MCARVLPPFPLSSLLGGASAPVIQSQIDQEYFENKLGVCFLDQWKNMTSDSAVTKKKPYFPGQPEPSCHRKCGRSTKRVRCPLESPDEGDGSALPGGASLKL